MKSTLVPSMSNSEILSSGISQVKTLARQMSLLLAAWRPFVLGERSEDREWGQWERQQLAAKFKGRVWKYTDQTVCEHFWEQPAPGGEEAKQQKVTKVGYTTQAPTKLFCNGALTIKWLQSLFLSLSYVFKLNSIAVVIVIIRIISVSSHLFDF